MKYFNRFRNNWPAKLAGHEYTTRSPSIPPQLALVIPSVSHYVDWEDFVSEVKEKHHDIVNVIRFKNKAQQPLRSVKLELKSAKTRNEILEAGEISIMHMKYKVVEYFAQVNVLICSNCYGIGHFRKNCPQKDESTCKTCGEKCSNLKDHRCSGVLKCVHCEGPHSSNDGKCAVVKDYRAALTRNLLTNALPTTAGNLIPQTVQSSQAQARPSSYIPSYSTVAETNPLSTNDQISKKLDTMLARFEEEFTTTRRAIAEVKEEMCARYTEMKKQVDHLESKVKIVEKKLEDCSVKVFSLLKNICTSLLDPPEAQSDKWKSYWQDQITVLTEYKSSLTTSNDPSEQ